ncbi:DUF3094 family protein [Agarilytica rhodophyticola]|uniref:DUF3094 family protein n=1 Tax=Agarilytica rhodophyticola TaxID=1737490 RepID=UPI000B34A04C|nr:DUF3094 family protein [Agarilytica rhodophyticola]
MPDLYPEDQKKVDEYLASSVHQVKRSPFKVLTLLGVIFAVLAAITVVSYLLALSHGVV